MIIDLYLGDWKENKDGEEAVAEEDDDGEGDSRKIR